MIGNCIINILSRLFILFVRNNFDFFHRDIPSDNIFPNMLICFIWRSIINIYNMVVSVILHKNRVQISQIQTCLDILVR